MNYSSLKKILIGFLLVIFSTTLIAKENSQEISISMKKWLYAGNISILKPLFSTEKNKNNKTWELSDELNFDQIDIKKLSPRENQPIKWSNGKSIVWMDQSSGNDRIVLTPQSLKNPEIAFLSTYISVDRWIKANIKISSPHLIKVWVDGIEIGQKTTPETNIDSAGFVSGEIKLETGKHLVLIKTIKSPESKAIWQIQSNISLSIDLKDNIEITTNPTKTMSINNLLYSENASNVVISANGEYAAISMYKVCPETKKRDSWVDIRLIEDGSLVQSFHGGMKISSLKWSPKENSYSYTTNENSLSTIWLSNIETGENKPILEAVKNLGDHTWSPDGNYIIYNISVDNPENKDGVRLLDGMKDRPKSDRNTNYLYKLNIPEGTCHRLTSGALSTYLHDINTDGSKILFSRYKTDYTDRPFGKSTLYILDMKTMTIDSLWTEKWLSSAQWSPDSKKILVTGGASMFNGVGLNVPKGTIPNDYDGQAFIYHLESQKADAITKNFNPAVKQAQWSKVNNKIYFVTNDRSHVNLYDYNSEKKRFSKINTGIEAVKSFDLSQNSTFGVYTGSSAAVPTQVYTINFNTKRFFGKKNKDYKILYSPAANDYKNVELSKVERWTFLNKDGVEIEGRIYLPPGFDVNNKYPCIVYYYGGTSPVSRDFDGRYPKNYWASNGYVVYVLQPSGATGFGQEFSAKHVNEWGTIVPDEIILGVGKFLEDHSYVDSEKLACIGASYGGFTTELLITKTDMFKAAASHAGISSIASYWGEGYWGYAYGAVANANKFPWQNKDFFVNNSALFNAHKINTPLLMTHGTADTNVPQGESIQLYTALKLLNKDVALLQCSDQNHFILEYKQREKWSKSIIAWFDKWLKDQPEWWNDYYLKE